MSSPNATAANPTGVPPASDKSEFDMAGSASNSDTEVHKTGLGRGRAGFTFAARGLGKDHYRPVESYEGIHRYDPDFEWEPEEEKRVVRKVRGTDSRSI